MISSCYLDLECSSLNANFGIVLVAVIKSPVEEPVILRGDELNPSWQTRRSDDSHIIRAILAELDKYDIIIAHNGTGHDIPFLRTRMIRWGLKALPKKKLVDPCFIARKQLKMSSNSLESLADFLGTKTRKKPVRGSTWLKASLDGDIKAMDEIVEHCRHDVLMLEEVANRLKDYVGVIDDRGSFQ